MRTGIDSRLVSVFRRRLVWGLAFTTAFWLPACGDSLDPLTVDQVIVTPTQVSILKDATILLEAELRNRDGNVLSSRPVVWSSSNEAVARVDTAGVVTGVGGGSATISASADGKSGAAEVSVETISFSIISSGFTHSCGLTSDGRAYCWGSNGNGELGDGTRESRPAPTPVATNLRFTRLSLGFRHSCALTADGAGYCWGDGRFGKLGNGGELTRDLPSAVVGGLSFVVISAGGDHTCGLAPDGAAYCWGRNVDGQLGVLSGQGCESSSACSLQPILVSGGHRFASISAGSEHTCAIEQEDAAFCWGHNQWGELGIGADDPPQSLTPLAVTGPASFTQMSASQHGYSCGVAVSDGRVYCWGRDDLGQLGRGYITNESHDVAPVASGEVFEAVYGALFHTCGLTLDGRVFCWGQNPFGLGHGATTPSETPVAVAPELRFVNLAVGWYRTCGVATDGIAYCWGVDPLGDGSSDWSSTPVRISGQP